MSDDDKKSTSDKDLLAEARTAFDRAEQYESINRQNWVKCVRFARLGEQWPEKIKADRIAEGRPCLTINRLPAIIRQVTNDARQNSPSMKFHPVGDGADEDTAKIYDGLGRNIETTSSADSAYDNALDNAVCGGFGYFRVNIDYAGDDVFDKDLRIEPIKNPLTVYGDPMSTADDSSDWNVCHVTAMWPKSEFKRKWPKAELSNFETSARDQAPGWYEADDIRVAEYWTREDVTTTLLLLSNGTVMHEAEYEVAMDLLDVMGVTIKDERPTTTKKVTQYIITGTEILETNEWAGKFIPIVPVYGDEVNVEGERYFLPLTYFAMDPQQMFNFWRTASTELVALAPKAPWVGPAGAFATDPNWATANTQSHQYLEYDPVAEAGGAAPQRQPFAGVPAGALQEAMNASDDIKSVTGLYDASMGAKSNETSGRAILARQHEGDTSTFNFTDNLSRAIRHTGRIICDLIPKTYSTARIIRVIHEDGSNKDVAINGATPPAPPPATTPAQQQKQQEEMAAVARVYDLTTGKYDVTCDTGPSYSTKRQEAATQMTEFMRSVPNAAALIGDLLAKNLDWPGADEIAERLKTMLPPQALGKNAQFDQLQQQMQQIQQALQQAQQQLKDAGRDKALEADKLRIDAFNAETNRLKVTAPAFGPAEIQAIVQQTLQQILSSPDVAPGAPAQQVQQAPQAQPEPQQQPMQHEPPPQMQQTPQPPPDGGFFSPEGNQ